MKGDDIRGPEKKRGPFSHWMRRPLAWLSIGYLNLYSVNIIEKIIIIITEIVRDRKMSSTVN